MKITIIGAGNMGRGIGTRAIAGGHEVEILDRDPAEARALADQLGGSASVLDPAGAFGGEIVVFAVYYPGIKEAVEQYADRLGGKVVVDITNPVDTQTWDRLATPPGSSWAEEVAKLVPQGTPVVNAFNTTFAPTLLAGEVDGQQLDVLIAGDDGGAKQKVSQLVADGGLRPIDVGPLGRAQQLEQLGFLQSPSSSRSASASRAPSSSIRDTPPRRRDGAEMSMEQALPRFEPDIRPLFRLENVIDAGSAP